MGWWSGFKCEALSSNPSTIKKKKKGKQRYCLEKELFGHELQVRGKLAT
jgi:phage FluMu gp28-like protein